MVAKYEGLEDRDVYEINKEGSSSLNIVADCHEYYGNFKKSIRQEGISSKWPDNDTGDDAKNCSKDYMKYAWGTILLKNTLSREVCRYGSTQRCID